MYRTLSITADGTCKAYTKGVDVRDVQQYTTWESFLGGGKNYTLLTKVSRYMEAGQESHKKPHFGADISKANLLQSLDLDFAGHLVGYYA